MEQFENNVIPTETISSGPNILTWVLLFLIFRNFNNGGCQSNNCNNRFLL